MAGNGTSSRAETQELVDEQDQRPCSRPISAIDNMQRRDSTMTDASSAHSASFFDEREIREAEQWVQQSRSSENARPWRKRRDSQLGSYDDHNNIFDGPSAEFVPSSVSSMHHNMARPSLHLSLIHI